jgi:hypothetical protein
VCFATLDTTLKRACSAFTANQLFRLELLGLLLGSNTVLFTTKVCIFTFETLIVGKFVHGEFLEITFEVF